MTSIAAPCSVSRAFAKQGLSRAVPSSRVALKARCASSAHDPSAITTRRNVLQGTLMLASLAMGKDLLVVQPAVALTRDAVLCDDACTADLESKELVTTASGLQYKDLVVGKGPSPPVGFQVVVNYVAMTPKLKVFDSSLERGAPYDIRVGTGQIVAGLDEGLMTMKPGGLRRLYIPGSLAFSKGLKAAAGRPTVPANTPVVFDVQLLYIPGLDDDE